MVAELSAQDQQREPDTIECVVCGAHASGSPLYRGLSRCRSCGHVSADMALTDEQLVALYDDKFFAGAAYSDYAAEERLLRKNFRLRFRKLKQFLEPGRHQRLFEIGSAYGFFLDEVRAEFSSVRGIDVSAAAVDYARDHFKLDVVQGDFLDDDYGDQKSDVVCLWDTIEHLRRPDRFVAKIADHTDPGALLALTTGDIESLNARLRKDRWRMIIPPVHLHYFSGRTLTALLRRFGFEVVYNHHCGFYRSLGNAVHNIVVVRHHKPWLFNQLSKTGLTNLGFYLNLYDITYIIARRVSSTP
ncbi:MAG TPA: class I SAM-dependent methyltransferase [Chthoniobacterales bacterium]|jgi:SAM-dependent methyltransferase